MARTNRCRISYRLVTKTNIQTYVAVDADIAAEQSVRVIYALDADKACFMIDVTVELSGRVIWLYDSRRLCEGLRIRSCPLAQFNLKSAVQVS